MIVQIAPELCRHETHEGCSLGGRGFGHTGNKTGALVFPDDVEVRSIASNSLASMIGDRKRLRLVRLHLIIVLQQIHIGPLQQTAIGNHVGRGFLTGDTSSNRR